MRGDLSGLIELFHEGHAIRPGGLVAEFLELSITGGTGSDFDLRLVARGRGAKTTFKRWESMDRRVRIGWFMEARLSSGTRFDEVVADAVAEFGIGRKSAEADLTYFRRCWNRCECKPGAEPKPIKDPELLDFLESWNDILFRYPNG